MGLFGSKKKEPVGLVGFLTDADKALAVAMQTKKIAPLNSYVDQQCARSLMTRIRSEEKEYAGLDRYKHVTWSKKCDVDASHVKYIKTVNYDHVKISHGVIAPVGVDYKEEWTVMTEGKPCVVEIRRISA